LKVEAEEGKEVMPCGVRFERCKFEELDMGCV